MAAKAKSPQSSAPNPAPLELVPRTLLELRTALNAETTESAESTEIAFAQCLAFEAVTAWWSKISRNTVPLRLPEIHYHRPLTDIAKSISRQFGAAAAELPIAAAAYEIGMLYSGALPGDLRGRHGIHYTPPALVDRIYHHAENDGLDWTTANVLDPAAGAGAFLIPAVQKISEAIANSAPAIALQNISTRIRGFEIDPFAAWLAQVFLEAVLLPTIEAAGRRPRMMIDVCNTLERKLESERFDLVVGNPPFGRVKLPLNQRTRFARSLYGHANLYGIFLDLGIGHVKHGGIVSFLTPSSFLAGEYFKNLRSLLWADAPPVSLDIVKQRKGVFEGVLQETVLATYKKGARRGKVKVYSSGFGAEQAASQRPIGRISLPRKSTAPWIVPRHATETALVRTLSEMPGRLADWGYTVSTGPLVWNRHKDQLISTAGNGAIPLIWAECITSDGRFVFRSERRNHEPYFLPRQDDAWLLVRKPCVLVQRTTAKEQPRRLIAAELPLSFVQSHGGVTVENHLNMLLPTRAVPAISAQMLAAFLNTSVADRAFRCLSGSVAVSAYELENLPMPDATQLKRIVGKRSRPEAVEDAASKLYGTVEI